MKYSKKNRLDLLIIVCALFISCSADAFRRSEVFARETNESVVPQPALQGEVLEVLVVFSEKRMRKYIQENILKDEYSDEQVIQKFLYLRTLFADTNQIDRCLENVRVLYKIADQGRRSVLEWLHSLGLNFDTYGKDGTVLHSAVLDEEVGMVRLLLSLGFNDINAQEVEDGDTPLHLAANTDNKEIYGLLLAAGADAEIQNECGLYARDIFGSSCRFESSPSIASRMERKLALKKRCTQAK